MSSKFFMYLKVVSSIKKAITLCCDNSATITNTKETINHKRAKHIDRKYHIIMKVVADGIMDVVTSEDNFTDLFTKTLIVRSFEKYLESMRMRNMTHSLH